MLKTILRKIPFLESERKKLNNVYLRSDWLEKQLSFLEPGSSILDAGCGGQQFKKFCTHLNYFGQDFGQYTVDEVKTLAARKGEAALQEYTYGKLDYTGDIWAIDEKDASFDAILCTSVFEHILYPIETVKEFHRLLRPDGTLVLTLPSNCLRHLDPYFYYSGFSDRWLSAILNENGFEIEKLEAVGDYYSWLKVEMARTALTHGWLAKLVLLPAFFYFRFKKPTEASVNTLCEGYHIIARKKK